jgi:lysophospholipase L1-like esterase
MKRTLQNISIALVSILISLVVCEVVARQVIPPQMTVKATAVSRTPSQAAEKAVTGDDGSIMSVIDWSNSAEKGVRLYPNVTATIHNHTLSKQDVTIRVNSLGLRGPQIGPKQPGEFRILNVGDSITFGDYVDESLTIPALLQDQLRSAGKQNVVVLNAGLPGATGADEFYHYLELAESVQPDVVLIGAYLNDAQETGKFYVRTLRFPFNVSRFLTWTFERFQLLDSDKLFSGLKYQNIETSWREKFRNGRNLTSGDQLGSRIGFDFEIYNAPNDFGLAWNPESWTRMREQYRAFAEIARRNGSQIAMHLFPVRMQVYARENILDTMPQREFLAICKEFDVQCYDLLPSLREVAQAGMKSNDMYYDHCHFKAEANKAVANALAQWLLAKGIVS